MLYQKLCEVKVGFIAAAFLRAIARRREVVLDYSLFVCLFVTEATRKCHDGLQTSDLVMTRELGQYSIFLFRLGLYCVHLHGIES